MDKFDFYFRVLERYDQYVQLANTKASNHITLLCSILVAVTALVAWGIDIEKLKNADIGLINSLVFFLYLLFLYLCYEWYSHCMNVIKPNRNRNSTNTPATDENELSTIFYSDVAKFSSFPNFKNLIINKQDDAHLEDLLHQVLTMAKVTEKKFDDYHKVNGWVLKSVVVSILILFLTVVTKIGG